MAVPQESVISAPESLAVQMRSWRDIRPALQGAAVVLAATIALAILALFMAPLAGMRPMVVLSGSMEPALEAGDVIVSRSVHPSRVRVGDILTFRYEDVSITHRVLEVRPENRAYAFVTRGDANSSAEQWSMSEEDEVGRLALRIPKLGFVVGWLSAPEMRAVLLGLPSFVLAVGILRRIWA